MEGRLRGRAGAEESPQGPSPQCVPLSPSSSPSCSSTLDSLSRDQGSSTRLAISPSTTEPVSSPARCGLGRSTSQGGCFVILCLPRQTDRQTDTQALIHTLIPTDSLTPSHTRSHGHLRVHVAPGLLWVQPPHVSSFSLSDSSPPPPPHFFSHSYRTSSPSPLLYRFLLLRSPAGQRQGGGVNVRGELQRARPRTLRGPLPPGSQGTWLF